MSTHNTAVDQRLLRGLSGADKLKLLMKLKAGTLAHWARAEGVDPIEIHHCLAARREYPEHRQRMAESLGLDRSEVDALIGPLRTGVAA